MWVLVYSRCGAWAAVYALDARVVGENDGGVGEERARARRRKGETDGELDDDKDGERRGGGDGD